jgi:hypothetical protein
VWEILIVPDDPSSHVEGDGARTPTVSVAFNLVVELRALLL